MKTKQEKIKELKVQIAALQNELVALGDPTAACPTGYYRDETGTCVLNVG